MKEETLTTIHEELQEAMASYDIKAFKKQLKKEFVELETEAIDSAARWSVFDNTHQHYTSYNDILDIIRDEVIMDNSIYDNIKEKLLEKIEKSSFTQKEKEELEEYVTEKLIGDKRDSDLLPDIYEKFDEALIKALHSNIQEDLQTYKSIGLVIGLNGDNTYEPIYKVYSTKLLKDKEDLKNALEEAGIEPHAYGTFRQPADGLWHNYWFEVINEDNYQDINDLDLATLYLTGDDYYEKVIEYKPENTNDLGM